MDCLLEQRSEICLFLTTSGQNVFHEEIFFCGKRIYFPTLSSHYSLLFKQSVLFFVFCLVLFCFGFFGGEGVRHSVLMIFLSWALYYAYKNAQILGAIQKVRTLWWRRGEGVLQKRAKTYKGRGIFQEYR